MSKLIEALKNLAVAFGCAATVEEVTGNTVDEVIQFIAENYTTPTPEK